jgi:hypothetical protein
VTLTHLAAIDNMRKSLVEVDPQEAKTQRNHYSSILRDLMDTMQTELESMSPRSERHIEYVSFCQQIISVIRARGSGIQPVLRFFSIESMTYWPDTADPKLYAAGLISYALRLRDQPTRASSELFYYLYTGWRNCLVSNQLQDHCTYIRKGLKHWEFTEFMLRSFIPATLQIGLNSINGWIIPSTYLPLVAKRVARLLQKGGAEGIATFGYLVNILKMIMNGIIIQNIRWKDNDQIFAIHPEHKGIISILCQFWLSIAPDMKVYVLNPHLERDTSFEDVSEALSTFAHLTIRAFDGSASIDNEGVWDMDQFMVREGPYVKNFTSMIQKDMDDNWGSAADWSEAMWSGTGWIEIPAPPPIRGFRRVNLELLWSPSLYQVLQSGLLEFETGYPCPAVTLASSRTYTCRLNEIIL